MLFNVTEEEAAYILDLRALHPEHRAILDDLIATLAESDNSTGQPIASATIHYLKLA